MRQTSFNNNQQSPTISKRQDRANKVTKGLALKINPYERNKQSIKNTRQKPNETNHLFTKQVNKTSTNSKRNDAGKKVDINKWMIKENLCQQHQSYY